MSQLGSMLGQPVLDWVLAGAQHLLMQLLVYLAVVSLLMAVAVLACIFLSVTLVYGPHAPMELIHGFCLWVKEGILAALADVKQGIISGGTQLLKAATTRARALGLWAQHLPEQLLATDGVLALYVLYPIATGAGLLSRSVYLMFSWFYKHVPWQIKWRIKRALLVPHVCISSKPGRKMVLGGVRTVDMTVWHSTWHSGPGAFCQYDMQPPAPAPSYSHSSLFCQPVAPFTTLPSWSLNSAATVNASHASELGPAPSTAATSTAPPRASTTVLIAPPVLTLADLEQQYVSMKRPTQTNSPLQWQSAPAAAMQQPAQALQMWSLAAPGTNSMGLTAAAQRVSPPAPAQPAAVSAGTTLQAILPKPRAQANTPLAITRPAPVAPASVQPVQRFTGVYTPAPSLFPNNLTVTERLRAQALSTYPTATQNAAVPGLAARKEPSQLSSQVLSARGSTSGSSSVPSQLPPKRNSSQQPQKLMGSGVADFRAARQPKPRTLGAVGITLPQPAAVVYGPQLPPGWTGSTTRLQSQQADLRVTHHEPPVVPSAVCVLATATHQAPSDESFSALCPTSPAPSPQPRPPCAALSVPYLEQDRPIVAAPTLPLPQDDGQGLVVLDCAAAQQATRAAQTESVAQNMPQAAETAQMACPAAPALYFTQGQATTSAGSMSGGAAVEADISQAKQPLQVEADTGSRAASIEVSSKQCHQFPTSSPVQQVTSRKDSQVPPHTGCNPSEQCVQMSALTQRCEVEAVENETLHKGAEQQVPQQGPVTVDADMQLVQLRAQLQQEFATQEADMKARLQQEHDARVTALIADLARKEQEVVLRADTRCVEQAAAHEATMARMRQECDESERRAQAAEANANKAQTVHMELEKRCRVLDKCSQDLTASYENAAREEAAQQDKLRADLAKYQQLADERQTQLGLAMQERQELKASKERAEAECARVKHTCSQDLAGLKQQLDAEMTARQQFTNQNELAMAEMGRLREELRKTQASEQLYRDEAVCDEEERQAQLRQITELQAELASKNQELLALQRQLAAAQQAPVVQPPDWQQQLQEGRSQLRELQLKAHNWEFQRAALTKELENMQQAARSAEAVSRDQLAGLQQQQYERYQKAQSKHNCLGRLRGHTAAPQQQFSLAVQQAGQGLPAQQPPQQQQGVLASTQVQQQGVQAHQAQGSEPQPPKIRLKITKGNLEHVASLQAARPAMQPSVVPQQPATASQQPAPIVAGERVVGDEYSQEQHGWDGEIDKPPSTPAGDREKVQAKRSQGDRVPTSSGITDAPPSMLHQPGSSNAAPASNAPLAQGNSPVDNTRAGVLQRRRQGLGPLNITLNGSSLAGQQVDGQSGLIVPPTPGSRPISGVKDVQMADSGVHGAGCVIAPQLFRKDGLGAADQKEHVMEHGQPASHISSNKVAPSTVPNNKVGIKANPTVGIRRNPAACPAPGTSRSTASLLA